MRPRRPVSVIAPADSQLLRRIAKYGCLTAPQLAVAEDRNLAALRRRLRKLARVQCIQLTSLPPTPGTRGRPPEALRLTPSGVRVVHRGAADGPDSASAMSHIPADAALPHLLLVNWFRVYLVDLERRIRGLSATFTAPASGADATTGLQAAPDLVPDGVFMLRHTGRDRTPLFFLEADRGTENMTSSDRSRSTIQGKLAAYRALFDAGGYKRYEPILGGTFQGFRLLILSETRARSAALCRFVAAAGPSDFVWLTCRECLFEHGLAGLIWARGGRDREPPESILGPRLATSAPAPHLTV